MAVRPRSGARLEAEGAGGHLRPAGSAAVAASESRLAQKPWMAVAAACSRATAEVRAACSASAAAAVRPAVSPHLERPAQPARAMSFDE